NRRLRLGVIGTGSVVREIYEYLYYRSAYSELIDVAAVCDASRQTLADFADRRQIPHDRRFCDYREMLSTVELDAVAVNTPDSMHAEPAIAALEAGLDVVLPKPTAERVEDVHRIIEAVRANDRLLGVDFHKREDPVVKEARARVAAGAYGTLQSATMHMLDRLLVADPNHEPRFFSSPDFAERNSPVTFLTSHMADAFIHITRMRPLEVRAIGYKQKLPSLEPISVDGYDLVDTSVRFEGGVSCHIVTGWAIPNTADCLTVQSARFVFSDGMLDLWDDHYGYREVTASSLEERNVLFRTFAADGTVSGYGMDAPGRIVEAIRSFRAGALGADRVAELRSPFELGLYTTLVCDCALASLEAGVAEEGNAVVGAPVDARAFLTDRLGTAADEYYVSRRTS
ncbi:MAG: Gfo/Idh/MocA family protein, partial [Spirochaetota bacterium]